MTARLIQVDARKRFTIPELKTGAMYFLRSDGEGGFVLEPAALVKPKNAEAGRYLQDTAEEHVGRFVKLDSRRRLTVTIARPRSLYFVHVKDDGTIHLEAAVAMPERVARRLRLAAAA